MEYSIDFEREELRLFDGLNPFEKWILNPRKFNYEEFDTRWLLEIESLDYILDRLSDISEIRDKIDNKLIEEFNPQLAEIKYRYFHK